MTKIYEVKYKNKFYADDYHRFNVSARSILAAIPAAKKCLLKICRENKESIRNYELVEVSRSINLDN